MQTDFVFADRVRWSSSPFRCCFLKKRGEVAVPSLVNIWYWGTKELKELIKDDDDAVYRLVARRQRLPLSQW